MLAMVLRDFGEPVVEEVPDPRAGPGEVVIDVTRVQPSVTECMLIAGEPVAMHKVLARRVPTQFGGHEFCGVVSAVGPDVRSVHIGQRVTAVETATCGTCAACVRDRPDACRAPDVLGFSRPGAFAEKVLVPARSVVPVPPGVSDSAAAAVQPLAGAIHAHALALVRPGESVLVIGTGVMGVLGVQVARHGGAGTVLAIGRSPAKRALAERFGAALADGRDAVLDATGGVGAGVVFETAGGPPSVGLAGASTLDLAARCVRRGGRIVVVSVLADDVAPLGLLRQKAVALLHPTSGAGGYSPTATAVEYGLDLVRRGDVDVECLVSHHLKGLAALPEALEITRNKAAHGSLGPAQVEVEVNVKAEVKAEAEVRC